MWQHQDSKRYTFLDQLQDIGMVKMGSNKHATVNQFFCQFDSPLFYQKRKRDSHLATQYEQDEVFCSYRSVRSNSIPELKKAQMLHLPFPSPLISCKLIPDFI